LRRTKFWIILLSLTNVITILLLAIISLRYGVPQKLLDRLGIISIPIKYTYQTEHYIERITSFSLSDAEEINIVMLGDSITEGINWNELLERDDISNQGIGEDTTEGFLNRVEYVYKLKPEMCFIMGGVNDLGKNIPIKNIMDNIAIIVSRLKENNIKVIMQSTLYVSKKWPFYKKRNKDIMKLNQQIKEYCNKYNVDYIDINQVVSQNGILQDKYTEDGVHLLENGYEKWKELILQELKNN